MAQRNTFTHNGTRYLRTTTPQQGRFKAVLLKPTEQEIDMFGIDAEFNFKLTEVVWDE